MEPRRLLSATLVSGPPSVAAGDAYVLDLNVPAQPSAASWAIDWGDGTNSTAGGDAASVSHAYAAPGTYAVAATVSPLTNPLDTTFGTAGKAVTDLGSADDAAYDVALQPDGKVLVAGGPGFSLARYHADGSVDATFGTGGKVTTDFHGSLDKAFALAVQDDGKLVVVGQARNGPSNYNWAIARYNADGSLDASFGAGGKVTADLGHDDDAAWAA